MIFSMPQPLPPGWCVTITSWLKQEQKTDISGFQILTQTSAPIWSLHFLTSTMSMSWSPAAQLTCNATSALMDSKPGQPINSIRKYTWFRTFYWFYCFVKQSMQTLYASTEIHSSKLCWQLVGWHLTQIYSKLHKHFYRCLYSVMKWCIPLNGGFWWNTCILPGLFCICTVRFLCNVGLGYLSFSIWKEEVTFSKLLCESSEPDVVTQWWRLTRCLVPLFSNLLTGGVLSSIVVVCLLCWCMNSPWFLFGCLYVWKT